MTTLTSPDLAPELLAELDDVRDAWVEWTEQWEAFKESLRRSGYNTYRLEAYRVGTGSDEGGGQSMLGWLDEIETDLNEPETEEAEADDYAPTTRGCVEGPWPWGAFTPARSPATVWCATHNARWLMGFVCCTGADDER